MKLTILGSGTAAPLLDRNCAGYLLEADNKKILFDSGSGTIMRLLELKINLFDIDNIFYTHLHNDHINDLGAIIWSNNYGLKRKKRLNLYGPKGFKKYYRMLYKLLKPTKLYFNVNVEELKNSTIKINDIMIRSFPTRHSSTTKSVIYRIEYKNKSFVYTGDTDYCDEVIEAARNADVLLIECSLPDDKKAEGHLTPSLCGKIAAEAKAKTLVLTHLYPEVLKTNIKKECSRHFIGKVIIAKDKMRLNV